MAERTPPATPQRAPLRQVPLPPLLAPLTSSTSSSLHWPLSSSSSAGGTVPSLNTQLKDLLHRSEASDSTVKPFSTAPSSPSRPPLPTPPTSPPVRPAAPAHGPPMQRPQNAHEALYGVPSSPPADGLPSSIAFSPPSVRGSTFLWAGSGTQRLGGGGGARRPLPIPPAAPTTAARTPYSPPLSGPRPLPPGASYPLPLPGEPSRIATSPQAITKVPLPASSRILGHQGFFDLLAASGSRLYSPSKLVNRVGVANGPATPWSPSSNISDPFAKEYGAGGQATTTAEGAGAMAGGAAQVKKKKRISVDMVGAPREFQHAVHASDAQQAEALLMRWNVDRQGKVGKPAWAAPIKEAVRAAHRAAGIAEAQFARDEELEDGSGLKVVNGLPDSVISSRAGDAPQDVSVATAAAVEDEDGEEQLRPPPPPFINLERNNSAESVVLRSSPPALSPTRSSPPLDVYAAGGTTRFSADALTRPGVPLSFDRPGALHSPTVDPLSLSPSFVPALATIERSASTKIFLETRYHALLRQPKSRETRKALLEKELARLSISEREKERVREAAKSAETNYLRESRAKVGVSSFVKLKTVGHGAFGVVSLVREKDTGQVYAMKELRKADMLKKGQEGHIRAERDILAAASTTTRWTVPLFYSFQDVDKLYLVMGYQAGGDLLSLLIEKDTFPESMARFYLAEMVLAVEETHKVLGAIHRDIKPDNFLFDAQGHLSIADFGLACDFSFFHDGAYFERQRAELLSKHGIDIDDGLRGAASRRNSAYNMPFDPPHPDGDNEAGPPSLLGWRERSRRKLAYSLVGTSNYMAVEVLRGTGYSTGADWWSLGVILYEMLFGFPPFVSKSRQETKNKIINFRSALRFPSRPRVSREAQDIIASLICEPEYRLGSRQRTAQQQRPNSVIVQKRSGFLSATGPSLTGVADDGADEIRRHPFFKGIDWSTLHLQTPPFQPQLKNVEDTRYFDDDIAPEPLPAPEIAPGVPAPDTTRDPLLRHPVEGQNLLALRKQQAFAGWTYKKPKNAVYDVKRGRIDPGVFEEGGHGTIRGRGRAGSRLDGPGSSFIRSLSV
ncbi:hypothetical protein JCM8547_001730 [Rhodosporidiobolus lusitaniae]